MKLTVKFGGETFIAKPLYSRDGRKRLCGAEDCSYCHCHLRTEKGRPEGYLKKRGPEFQAMIPCPEPCKRIKEKCAHLCEFKDVYFVKERGTP